MANGETVTRDLGYAIIRYREFETIDEVVFARDSDFNCWDHGLWKGSMQWWIQHENGWFPQDPCRQHHFYRAAGG